jgi:hypothetical protein
MTRDPLQALDALVDLGIDRVLTSGQEATVLEGLSLLTKLFEFAGDRIVVMPGGGKSTEAPFSVNIPDTQKDVDFIEKDSKRFADSNGWGYAEFAYDAASDTFTPTQKDAKCGAACHTIVAAKDYIFTAYGHR